MNRKLFLLPGFGEDAYIFDKILPYLKDFEIIHVNYRTTLNQFKFPSIKREEFCKKLIKEYQITKNDKLVGHSMGGYFSYQIRELIGSEICMIASFNDTNKVKHVFPKFRRFTQLATFTGLIKSDFIKKAALSKTTDPKIIEIDTLNFDNMRKFSNKELSLMLEMLFEKGMSSKLPNPLRIHDIKDKVIATPDENFIQVSGGHFCLYIYAEETFNAMKDFLLK